MTDNRKKLLLIEGSICSGEIRVALSINNKIVEFEQEFRERKQLRGNVYVAYIKRIEPSLQAVFIEYGKNKQGFLSFSEISLDYFNIPEKEKELLFANYANIEENDGQSDKGNNDPIVKDIPIYRKYKLQDVISINQKVLVQLTKEERGNKGASFTTYITLVGRYCVLMPNSMSKGGVSRRIEDNNTRKQLREILNSIELQERAGLIIRTVGAGKSKKEIKQDYDYLNSLWQNIQRNTSATHVPSLIYSEADIIMRSIRDFCDSNAEIIVSSKEIFEIVRQYTKQILKDGRLRSRLYRGSIPIFTYYAVEEQISELYSNKVKLTSGGSLVITLTEAFVAIDVNSGRMMEEDSIEETAYRTNMEAVPEIARQVNLRGLSGLIVIDFIDMVKYQYCRAVESAIRQAFKDDRAKVQFSYINDFGLMVLSRQRIKSSIQEINTMECSYCKGIGRVRSNEVIATSILRNLQHVANKNRNKPFDLIAHGAIIAYIFNTKRSIVTTIENEFNIVLNVTVDNSLDASNFVLKAGDEMQSDYIDVAKPLKNFGYQLKEKENEGANKLHSSFWLTRWLSRIFNLNN